MSSKYEKPHYIKNKNANITQIPQGEKPYFYLDVGEYIYSITKSILLAKAFIFAIRKTLSLLMPAYFYFVKKIYLKDSSLSVAQFKKKYILLLMQYHPERTTSNRAHDTPFDIKRIEVLSKLFPNHKIIVYEHFMNINNFRAFCYRPIDFFYRISNLANVTYLSPQNNDFYRQLVMNSLVTISTSGTHAIESPQVGVPSIHLSNSFARNLPGVITLTDLSDLSLDMINSEIEYLKSLSKGEYIDLVLDVLNQRPFNEGFIAGYHNEKYDKSKYIHDAHMIIYNHLKYCLSNDYSK